MFPFITRTWNPLGGECNHRCDYCWARKLAADKKMAKYQGEPRLVEKEMQRVRGFKSHDFVFVCDMLDLFGEWVSSDLIKAILSKIAYSPATFLLLTKNPKRYFELLDFLPKNAVLGCTIESDRNYSALSKAPDQVERIYWMTQLSRLQGSLLGNRLFFSVEPILDFNLMYFGFLLLDLKPWAVAVGYDNYDNKLLEPLLAKTMQLIDRLEKAGITVYRKTLREAWNQ